VLQGERKLKDGCSKVQKPKKETLQIPAAENVKYAWRSAVGRVKPRFQRNRKWSLELEAKRAKNRRTQKFIRFAGTLTTEIDTIYDDSGIFLRPFPNEDLQSGACASFEADFRASPLTAKCASKDRAPIAPRRSSAARSATTTPERAQSGLKEAIGLLSANSRSKRTAEQGSRLASWTFESQSAEATDLLSIPQPTEAFQQIEPASSPRSKACKLYLGKEPNRSVATSGETECGGNGANGIDFGQSLKRTLGGLDTGMGMSNQKFKPPNSARTPNIRNAIGAGSEIGRNGHGKDGTKDAPNWAMVQAKQTILDAPSKVRVKPCEDVAEQSKTGTPTEQWVESHFSKIRSAVNATFRSYKTALNKSRKTEFLVAIQKEISKEILKLGGPAAFRFAIG
jgi:hypothetical protein